LRFEDSQGKYFTRPYLEKPFTKNNRAGGVVQGEGPEFKPQYCKKQKKGINNPLIKSRHNQQYHCLLFQTTKF
jgi:hypothetical protein